MKKKKKPFTYQIIFVLNRHIFLKQFYSVTFSTLCQLHLFHLFFLHLHYDYHTPIIGYHLHNTYEEGLI